MANTIDSSIFVQEVTSTVLGALRKLLVPFRAFSTDVSAEAVSAKARSIIVPLVGSPTAQAHTGDYTANADTTDTSKTVTLDQHDVSTFHLSDIERMEISNSVWPASALEKVEGAVFALGTLILNNLLGKVVSADFTNSIVCLPADFDADFVGSQRTWANLNGFNTRRRSIMAGSDYMEVLAGDPTLSNNFALADANPMLEGKIARVKGFDVIEYDQIPTNSQNLEGIIVDPRALAVAIRPVEVSQPGEMIYTSVITDEDSGLSMTYTIWYDRTTRKEYHNIEAKHGASVGKTGALRRIVSA